jgi:hypothetical protein
MLGPLFSPGRGKGLIDRQMLNVGPSTPGLQLSATNPHHPHRILFAGHHGAYEYDVVWYSDDGGTPPTPRSRHSSGIRMRSRWLRPRTVESSRRRATKTFTPDTPATRAPATAAGWRGRWMVGAALGRACPTRCWSGRSASRQRCSAFRRESGLLATPASQSSTPTRGTAPPRRARALLVGGPPASSADR